MTGIHNTKRTCRRLQLSAGPFIYSKKEHRVGGLDSWVQFSALMLTFCTALSKIFNLPELIAPAVKVDVCLMVLA